MIQINSLGNSDIGRWVTYHPSPHHSEDGRIKDWNDQVVFVVYQCDDRWDDYQQYTPQATSPRDLDFMEEIPLGV
jgi:hypothetical protein